MQKLNLPAYLCPTSQSSGGEVHSNAAALTAPGSVPTTPMPQPDLLEMADLPVNTVPDAADRWLVDTDGAKRQPQDSPFPESGGWKQATSSAAGWDQL